MMKLYRLRLKTAGKTAEDVKKDYDFDPPSDEMCEKIAESYRQLDGLVVIGAEWEYSPNTYSIYGWNEDADDRFKEFIYLAEQDEIFGNYVDNRERFEIDWKNGEYESSGSLHFDKIDCEMIEFIQNETSQ